MSFSKSLSVASLTAMALLFAALPARAQIYTWRDDAGNLILSNKKPGSSLRTFAVPEAPSVRATRAVPLARARQYDDLIAEHSRANGVRTDLVRAVMQIESGFNPVARSVKGAMGLMQLMPATARQFGVSDPYNPADNIRGGVAYLRMLLDRYQGNEQLALAAYNAGPGAVDKYGESVPPYQETRKYVSKIGQLAGARTTVGNVRIYRTVEVIDGREVVRYTDKPPK